MENIFGNKASGNGEGLRTSAEYKEAFWAAMRKQFVAGIKNALSVGDKEDGGYLVPDEFEKKILDAIEQENVFRTLATAVQTSAGEKKIPITTAHGAAAWVDEFESIPESDEKFGVVKLGAHKMATIIRVSEELMHDSVFDLEGYLAKEFAKRFGRLEEEAFIDGDGAHKPLGILRDCQFIETAEKEITAEDIIDLYHSVPVQYRSRGTFLASDAVIKEIRKLKDEKGDFICAPFKEGVPDTILGRPYKTSFFMPDKVKLGTKVLLFGDFSQYWIADRKDRAFTRLDELYAIEGQVGFKATQRVDGKLVMPEAVKALKIKE